MCYDQAIALKPDHAAAWKNRGAARAAQGRLEEALANCDRAIALNPDYAEAHADRAAALTALGRVEEALSGCDRAIALKPDTAEARFNKGACHLALGDFDAGGKVSNGAGNPASVLHVPAFPGFPGSVKLQSKIKRSWCVLSRGTAIRCSSAVMCRCSRNWPR